MLLPGLKLVGTLKLILIISSSPGFKSGTGIEVQCSGTGLMLPAVQRSVKFDVHRVVPLLRIFQIFAIFEPASTSQGDDNDEYGLSFLEKVKNEHSK